jgi:hypothetical protein
VDFAYDPVERVMWAQLDRRPSSRWVAGLGEGIDPRTIDVEVAPGADRPPSPQLECDRVYLTVARISEPDAFTLLAAYVRAANILVHRLAAREHT